MVIISYKNLHNLRKKYSHKKIVFCSGTFDLTHAGHILFFEDCKKYGDILVVAVAPDSFIKKYKGNSRPILNEFIRLKTIDSIKSVDFSILHKDAPDEDLLKPTLDLVYALKPNVWVVNEDSIEIDRRKKTAKETSSKFILLKRWSPKEFGDVSTTKIINKIKNLKD